MNQVGTFSTVKKSIGVNFFCSSFIYLSWGLWIFCLNLNFISLLIVPFQRNGWRWDVTKVENNIVPGWEKKFSYVFLWVEKSYNVQELFFIDFTCKFSIHLLFFFLFLFAFYFYFAFPQPFQTIAGANKSRWEQRKDFMDVHGGNLDLAWNQSEK